MTKGLYTVQYEDEATCDAAVAFETPSLEEAILFIRELAEHGAEYEDLYIVAPNGYDVIEFEL